MTDSFAPVSAEQLFNYIFSDNLHRNLLSIPPQLFFDPFKQKDTSTKIFHTVISTPIGVAAGPHSQLAQNIIAAWLCGARYIELKTVQTLDELTIPKPCIDMQDEGYNCEWSQELKIRQSFDEYLKAWIFIHILSHKLGYGDDPQTIFNMSAGYNFESICQENVQWFLQKMGDCKEEKGTMISEIAKLYPEIISLDIPDKISDNITLSTMHGCPPEEIEKIGKYLIEEKKLHTFIKLNPTLFGPEKLRSILNDHLKYKTIVPDEAFEHDLKFDKAVEIIKSLSEAAAKNNVFFGIKLTNTLESMNNRKVFSPSEKMMYMSGRALHAISVNVAYKLQSHFNGSLHISFSGGADCTNIPDILNCGIYPVTVCTDLLKPGGYGRLKQYTENISSWISGKAKDVATFNNKLTKEEMLTNLKQYADAVLTNDYYQKNIFSEPNIKSGKKLNTFDCINAPCVNTCPTNQDIPEYLYQTAHQDFKKAMEVILKTNPLPAVCGMVCDHECQTKCTRINYDDPLMIREVKRFITEQKTENHLKQGKGNKLKVAIIGAGPSGLSCSFFLALAGFEVKIYETKALAGGMVSDAIPQFRLTQEAIEADIERVKALGVQIVYESLIDRNSFKQLQQHNDYIYIAVGAQKAKPFDIPGKEAKGVIDPLVFLSEIKKNNNLLQGDHIAVVGGGNTAIDVARTAKRLVGNQGRVSILYRRNLTEMPAGVEEIKAVLHEGIEIHDFTLPFEIISQNGIMTGLKCWQMKAGEPDADGRAKPMIIEGSEFIIDFDTLIPALGQDIVMDFLDDKLLQPVSGSHQTQHPNIFFGGDALRGASNVIKAIADGRRSAAEIIKASVQDFDIAIDKPRKHDFNELMILRSQREFRKVTLDHSKKNISMDEPPSRGLNREEAVQEASRCMHCDELCNICVTVCPNRANLSYKIEPQHLLLQKALLANGNEIIFADGNDLLIKQEYQVLNVADFCNECGNCTTFCPTSGRPFTDKPRFFINISKFKESEGGYFFNITDDKTILVKKTFYDFSTLALENERFVYQNEKVSAYFLPDFTMVHVKFHDQQLKEYHFDEAAEMYVLFNALKHLPFFKGN
jgi:putative selenate reductase